MGSISDKAHTFLIFGSDEFSVSKEAKRVVDALCPPEEQTFGLEIVDGAVATVAEAVEAVQKAIDGVRTVSFLGGGKVVWLKDVSFFSQTPVGRSEDVKTRLAALGELISAGLPDGQRLVITSPKVFKTAAFYKLCKKHAELISFDVEEQESRQGKQALERAIELFKESGLKIRQATLVSFVERTGMNTRQMVQEIEKLRLYVGDGGTVDDLSLDLLVAPTKEAMMWSLSDAVGSRDMSKILRLLKQLFYQKESAVGMIIMLERHYSRLVLIRSCMDKGWMTISQGGRQSVQWNVPAEGEVMLTALAKDDPRKGHPYRALLAAKQAALYSTRELVWCRERMMQAHKKMVSSSVPPELQLELAVMEIAGRKIFNSKRRRFMETAQA